MVYRKNLHNKFMIGSIVADIRRLMLNFYWFILKELNQDINAKERSSYDVYAKCPVKLDDNHAYCHHAGNRRFDMD